MSGIAGKYKEVIIGAVLLSLAAFQIISDNVPPSHETKLSAKAVRNDNAVFVGSSENLLDRATKWQLIQTIWNNQKDKLASDLRQGLQEKNTTVLYDYQINTNNLLTVAYQDKKYDILDDIAGHILIAYDFLQIKNDYTFYYIPGKGRSTILPLLSPARMWIDQNGEESIIDSSQFLYLTARSIHIFLGIEEKQRTEKMKSVITKFLPMLLNDHYERWIFSKQGIFQVRGWGGPDGVFNHYSFLEKKLNGDFSQAKNTYCNVVTDDDMWIIAGVIELLAANRDDPKLVPFSPKRYDDYKKYASLGMNLIESRLTPSQLKDFQGKAVSGLNFDLNLWNDHPDYAYAGYVGDAFPEPSNKKATSVAWDLSHSRRFIQVFDSMYQNKAILGQEFPSQNVMQGLANQLIYGTYNRDFRKPLFTNFMNGANGWYRVNYSNRRGFGYAPYDMSIAVIEGGYGFWEKNNKDMKIVMNSLWQMITSKEPSIIEHRKNHYENYVYQNYERRGRSIDLNNSLDIMNFLASYSTQ